MTVGLVTAIASVITALGLLFASLAVFLPALREIRKVHTIVNQHQTDLLRYQRALITALRSAGVAIPEDQSVDNP